MTPVGEVGLPAPPVAVDHLLEHGETVDGHLDSVVTKQPGRGVVATVRRSAVDVDGDVGHERPIERTVEGATPTGGGRVVDGSGGGDGQEAHR